MTGFPIKTASRKTVLRKMVWWAVFAGAGWPMVGGSFHAQAQAPAQFQPVARRHPLTGQMVLAAMQERHLPVAGADVRLSAPVTSSVANPMLEIQSMTIRDRQTAQLLIACRNSSECLPFYVSATFPKAVDLVSQHVGLAPQDLGSRRPEANEVDANGLLKAGTQAVLMLDDSRIHIRLRVVLLETGAPGEKVRVVTPDRRQAFVAEVVNANELKGFWQ